MTATPPADTPFHTAYLIITDKVGRGLLSVAFCDALH
jgi:hypothetical protein